MTLPQVAESVRCLWDKVNSLSNSGSSVTPTSTDTFENKTISGSNNTLSNIAQSAITGLVAALLGKQDTLVSNSNIKTVGGTTLLGTGNIPFPTPATQTDASVFVTGTFPDARLSGNVITNTGTQTLQNKTLTIAKLNGLRPGITNKTATATLLQAETTVVVDATGGAVILTLGLASASFNTVNGQIYIIKKIDASVNTVTLKGNGSELIDGANTVVLSLQWSYVEVQSNGTQWYIIGKG